VGQFSKLQWGKEGLENLPDGAVVGGRCPNLTALCGKKNLRRSNITAGFVFSDKMRLDFNKVEALKDFFVVFKWRYS